MNDQELLVAAAKAAGIAQSFLDDELRFEGGWNPLQSDSDEARLEATLSLNVEWWDVGVAVGGEFEPYRNHPDKQTARRRAGVRAAAIRAEEGE